MFSDPQTIHDLSGSDVTFTRTNIGGGVGEFTSEDGTMVATIRQTKTKTRARHEVRVTVNKVGTDPLNPAINVAKSASCYIVYDEPLVGFTDAELTALGESVRDWDQRGSHRTLLGEF